MAFTFFFYCTRIGSDCKKEKRKLMTSVDIIVPCYNEEEGLALFYQETQMPLPIF